ncbi:hypothetical protein H5410_028672 [Solanum commersonii]|uniref:Uncharacterized protein n=1 Tax=Solanum commersonii TaxID=4109 RepID=A0A9J5Z6T7_SOLCO|nr:hypothetical protein H5410_028672 [Solanum commersonii]
MERGGKLRVGKYLLKSRKRSNAISSGKLVRETQITIKEVLSNGTWNWNILQPQLNEETKAYKIIDINIRIVEHKNDIAI